MILSKAVFQQSCFFIQRNQLILKKNSMKIEEVLISIIMGSKSDYPVMKPAVEFLKNMEIPYEVTIVSAHRTPERMFEFAKNAQSRGIKVIIAGAGGAAHLPGMVASISILPVIGVPILSSNSIDGWDSILSILQMPGGVPVATVALNQSLNAAILASQILALNNPLISKKLEDYKFSLKEKVINSIDELPKD
jgi:5-(carboxyamino)imidazole ribonucleotide mutase